MAPTPRTSGQPANRAIEPTHKDKMRRPDGSGRHGGLATGTPTTISHKNNNRSKTIHFQ